MRLRIGFLVALIGIAVGLGLWAHQGLTQDNNKGKPIAILSTTDIIGYTGPCG
jgi:hypothetical protein